MVTGFLGVVGAGGAIPALFSGALAAGAPRAGPVSRIPGVAPAGMSAVYMVEGAPAAEAGARGRSPVREWHL